MLGQRMYNKLIMLVFEMANKQGPLLLHAEYPLSTHGICSQIKNNISFLWTINRQKCLLEIQYW